MSEPIRITCRNADELPSAEDLERLVTRGRHVVLQFPVRDDAAREAFDAGTVIRRLRPLLREDIDIFDAGGWADSRCVTVQRVVSRQVVIDHEDEIHAAAVAFRAIATDLVSRLAERLGLSADEIAREPLVRLRFGDRGDGLLDEGWEYAFHGLECRFYNSRTRQVVEVQLDFGNEFGVIDPYFFHMFLASTERFAALAVILPEAFADTCRAMEVLAERGRLRRVTSTVGAGEGLVASDEE